MKSSQNVVSIEKDVSGNSLHNKNKQKKISSKKNYGLENMKDAGKKAFFRRIPLRRYSVEDDYQKILSKRRPYRWYSMGEDLADGLLWKKTSQMVFCGSSPVSCVSFRRRPF